LSRLNLRCGRAYFLFAGFELDADFFAAVFRVALVAAFRAAGFAGRRGAAARAALAGAGRRGSGAGARCTIVNLVWSPMV
jgi:hypothetical protein